MSAISRLALSIADLEVARVGEGVGIKQQGQ